MEWFPGGWKKCDVKEDSDHRTTSQRAAKFALRQFSHLRQAHEDEESERTVLEWKVPKLAMGFEPIFVFLLRSKLFFRPADQRRVSSWKDHAIR